jgi:TusA-related sulfurtransferase
MTDRGKREAADGERAAADGKREAAEGKRAEGERDATESDRDEAELLDVRGTLCPVPILLTARRLRELPAAARLEVIGDDLGIVEDMPVWCEETGNRLLSLEREGDVVRCVVEKT